MKSVAAIRSLHRRTCLLPIARVSTTTAGSAVRPQGPKGDGAVSKEKQRREEQRIGTPPATDNVADNIPPFAPSPKLESHEVSRPGDPSFQQKRRWSNAAAPSRAPLVDVSCLGADGSPLAGGESDGAFGADVDEDEEYRAYYKQHMPSPLSEIKFVDTRKPISRAWDAGAGGDGEGMGLIVEDTVDEALQRAEALFRAAKERGDPDLPHSRALARMLRQTARQGLELEAMP